MNIREGLKNKFFKHSSKQAESIWKNMDSVLSSVTADIASSPLKSDVKKNKKLTSGKTQPLTFQW